MKVAIVLAALVAVACCELCPSGNTDQCTTTCTGTDWNLHCKDGQCVCSHDDLSGHNCVTDDDCKNHGQIGSFCNLHFGGLNFEMKCVADGCHCRRA